MTVSPFALAMWAVEANHLTVKQLRVIVSVSVWYCYESWSLQVLLKSNCL